MAGWHPQQHGIGGQALTDLAECIDEGQAVADALAALVAPTMAEPGVKLFLPYRSPTDPKAFFIFELYRNEAGWAEHQRTDHFKSFADKMLPRLARRERVPFVPFASNR